MTIQNGTAWDKGVRRPKFSIFKTPLETDVVIIGGGITGVTAAHYLTMAGKNVVIVEKNKVGFGATGVTTAFLTQSIDTDTKQLIKMFGKKKAELIFESHQNAINEIEKIVKNNKIDCGFERCSNFAYFNNEDEKKDLEEQVKAANSIGISMKFKTDNELVFKNYGYLELKNQAKFHPLKYLYSLSKKVKQQGGLIYENIEVKEISGKGPFILETTDGQIKANKVIVATYAPFDNELFFKKAFYDSYVFELEIEAGVLKEGTYEDSKDPYHYFRVDRNGKKDRIIIGGEDHRSDIPVDNSKNYQALLDYTKNIFAQFDYKIVRKWEGPILETVDGLAYIGENKKKGIYYATGFSGNGMTYSNIAARIISDQILGKKNPYSLLYDASRKPTIKQLSHKGADYMKELAHGAIKNSVKYRKRKI